MSAKSIPSCSRIQSSCEGDTNRYLRVAKETAASSSWSAAGFAIVVSVVSLLISIACIIIVCKTSCGE